MSSGTRTRSLASRVVASLSSIDGNSCSTRDHQQREQLKQMSGKGIDDERNLHTAASSLLPTTTTEQSADSTPSASTVISSQKMRRLESVASHLRKYSITTVESPSSSCSDDTLPDHSHHDPIDCDSATTNNTLATMSLSVDSQRDTGTDTDSKGDSDSLGMSNDSDSVVSPNASYAYSGRLYDNHNGDNTECGDQLTPPSKASSLVVGPGGVTIPPMNQLKTLLPTGTIEIICLTWNVASKSQTNLARISGLLAEGHPSDRADVVCVSFQELPSTNAKYHEDALKQMNEALHESHSTFCWVRKWSQMLMVFIRKSMISFASAPEWQFISSTAIVKPIRTKGAIAVYFRLFQSSVLLIASHLSHGPLVNRLNDYSKICELLKFPAIQRFNLPACQSIRNADCIFWFGDLNFRLTSRQRVDALICKQMLANNAPVDSFFSDLLIDDELTIEKCKGTVFAEFEEAHIDFPPTHKFIIGSNDYVSNRIPSYTDRILYYSKGNDRIKPLLYESLWDEDCSDHKPVYAVFTLRVVEHKPS
ncbi:unnamed protein product [Anisakis simplex]|uniref:IPPc domain-containing protein n=1 Tax=Anisakis simplex TaxID=6269 RepID=A0A0M3JTU6_ANISI|nr:unnamed protein product [Anisakis simplex]